MSEVEATKAVHTRAPERAAYAAYFAGQYLVYTLIQSFMVLYGVSYLKLDPALIATLILVVRIWDAVNDPLIGVLMDRFRFRTNRFKTWINLTAFLVPLATFLLFSIPPEASVTVKVIWLVVVYLFWDLLYTASEVPAYAISTAMTMNERERTALLALTRIGSTLGVAAAYGLIAALQGDTVDEINWLLVAGLPSALTLVLMLPQMFFLRERFNVQPETDARIGDMLRDILRNDQLLIIMSLFLSQAFLNAVPVFSAYVSESYYGDPRLASLTGVFSLLGVVLLGAFTPAIVARWGKKRFLEVAMLATLALSIPIFFIPGSMPILAMVFLGLRITTLVVTSLLRPMFTADSIEYGEHKTGVRSESSAFAIQTFFNKSGDALGAALGGYILAWVGFNETLPLDQQGAGVINSLWLWHVILPIFMAAVMFAGVRWLYRLDEEQVKGYIETNAARRAEAAAAD